MYLLKLVGKLGVGVFGLILFLALIIAVSALWWGFVLMIVLSVVHHYYHGITPWGYGTCYPLGLLMSCFLG